MGNLCTLILVPLARLSYLNGGLRGRSTLSSGSRTSLPLLTASRNLPVSPGGCRVPSSQGLPLCHRRHCCSKGWPKGLLWGGRAVSQGWSLPGGSWLFLSTIALLSSPNKVPQVWELKQQTFIFLWWEWKLRPWCLHGWVLVFWWRLLSPSFYV